jgi:serine/threonine-protein kinase
MNGEPVRLGRSILRGLEERGAKPPRVRLPGEEEAAPATDPVPLRSAGRYEVLGRIARGGIGLILRGRDLDLNRDVVLKVLRERHAGNADLLKRFVEEAQIGGQLQHPGIVPVHGLGLLGARRPYIAMKLVKGRTLAAVLAEREDPAAGRTKLLGLFVKVAETVAYAHSRGVIHRDLKPSNVMLGRYGEVLVVDFGFAKVLSHGGVADERRARRSHLDLTKIATLRSSGDGSDSIPGSIMGTPAYMPPEQALGQIEDLDERSDVFALGAVLTEILTGKPPYVGEESDVLVQAVQGNISEAHARLDGCGAEKEIADVAKACLAPLKKDRPRDAGAVARAVAAHLADMEEREKRSKVAAAEMRRAAAVSLVKTSEERRAAAEAARESAEERARAERAKERAEEARQVADRARRGRLLFAGVAAGIFLCVAVAGGGFLRYDSLARSRAEKAAGAMSGALDAAWRLESEERYGEAILEAERAERHAADVGGAVLTTAREARARIEGKKLARERAEWLTADNDRLRTEMDAARAEWSVPSRYGDVAARAAKILGSHGLSLEVRSPAEAARLIRERGPEVAADVAAFLDEEAWLRRTSRFTGGRGFEAAAAVAGLLDADGTRAKIRSVLPAADLETLRQIARGLDSEREEARTAALLGFAFLASGEPWDAMDLLRPAQILHLGDFWLNLGLARACLALDPPRRSMAARFLAAGYALKPHLAGLHDEFDRTRVKQDALSPFRERYGWRDPARWFAMDLNASFVTETRRRLYADKDAVTRALMKWPAGREFEAWKEPPLAWPDGTVFVAENIDVEGEVVSTDVVRLRSGCKPEFLHFGEDGALTPYHPQPMGWQAVPASCERCHLAITGSSGAYHDPTNSFPDLAPGRRQILVEGKLRSIEVWRRFRETYHRENGLFAPYATVWIGRLAEGEAAGTLSPEDRAHLAALKTVFPEFFAGEK